VVHPIITLLRTATGATSLPHRRRQKSGQWAAPHRRRSLSSRQFSPARFHSAPIDRCTRSILFPSRCTTTRCNRAYCGIVNFVPALKGDSVVVALVVPYASNIEEAVTRHVISEQHVVPSNLLYWPALVREKEIRQRERRHAEIYMYLS